jgi:hypothetical protein
MPGWPWIARSTATAPVAGGAEAVRLLLTIVVLLTIRILLARRG